MLSEGFTEYGLFIYSSKMNSMSSEYPPFYSLLEKHWEQIGNNIDFQIELISVSQKLLSDLLERCFFPRVDKIFVETEVLVFEPMRISLVII